jgi:hypothetical protein
MDNQHLRRRRGQTTAEFALTLPILLILLFGIIEFGRIFQAWVTLQNAARTAARFASTGRPFVGDDTGGFNLDSLVPCVTVPLNANDPSGPINEAASDQRGTTRTISIGGNSSNVTIYENGTESLFATMFDGENCQDGDSHSTGDPLEHYYRRGDLVRMLLIYQEARRGAAGLALEADPYPITQEGITDFLYDNFTRPFPRSDQRQWFNVVVCSGRPLFRSPEGDPPPTDASTTQDGQPSRFRLILTGPDAPACILNEVRNFPNSAAGGLVNAGRPWMDPGGPGDSVSIVVTFNHPLITPLGLANYLPLQARRSAVNETFRAASAVSALQGGGQIGPVLPTLTFTPTETATNTPTETLIPTATNTPAPTATETLAPNFTCSAIRAENPSFFQNRVYIDIRNNNAQATNLVSMSLNWRTVGDYPNMYMGMMTLNGEIFWQGNDQSPPTVSNADPGFIAASERVIPGGTIGVFEGIYLNGPGLLSDYLTMFDFANTSFTLFNPTGGANCVITLALPQPTPSPTRDVRTPLVNPTPTGTPDCASSLLRLEFVSWDSFGVVKLQVVNNRTVVAPFTAFNINWGNIMTRANLAPGVLTLKQVTVGGNSPADPLSFRVWDAPAGQDATSPTNSATEGTWRGNFTFQPRSVTSVYLDFDGTSTNLQSAFGAQLSDFNGTSFTIGCGNPGAGTGGTGGSTTAGQIQLNGGSFPTQPPTNTRGPTNTPFPTYTPSRTPTRGPATMTFTPRPTVPTATRRPATNTPLPPTPTTPPRGDDNPGG